MHTMYKNVFEINKYVKTDIHIVAQWKKSQRNKSTE